MKRLPLILAVFLLFSLAVSQPRRAVPFRHEGPPLGPLSIARNVLAQDTVRVLALMVAFKQDSDTRTTGDGTFETAGTAETIDPPPHDSAFFSQKLRFLRNYFSKVSNNQLEIQADLYPSVVTLGDTMAAYSPPASGPNEPLGRLIQDGWTAASTLTPSFPFSSYNAFILFHAGAGRDIDLINLLGYDPTPGDIPSLYVDLESLRSFLNDPAYQGVPVNGGAFRITNSLILPETETRVIGSGTSASTISLGMNGLLAATFGSYLGLPDLFNTSTGASGIGDFGLMDGAAIFAYSGLFPPEPSAWEKIRLGWARPIVLSSGTQTISLPAVGLTTTGQDTIYKIPITSSEYFLIENRIRDPLQNGQTLTLIQNGQQVVRTFGADTTGFIFNDVSAVTGSLVDAEDFDWAISGDMAQAGYEGGGILIWHIDDNIINANIQTNTINADPEHRGVDLEEADGSQDLGRPYGFLDPGSGTESGWPLDQWFQGNPAPVYTNTFDGTSYPNSNSNAGTSTLVSIREFSAKSPRMTLTVGIGTSQLARLDTLTFSLGLTSTLPPAISPTAIALSADSSVFLFRTNGLSKTSDTTGLLSSTGGQVPVAVWEGANTWVAGGQDSTVFLWDLGPTTSGISAAPSLQTLPLGEQVSSGPMIIDSAGTPILVVGGAAGGLWKFSLNGTLRSRTIPDGTPVLATAADPTTPGSLFLATSNSLIHDLAMVSLPATTHPWIMTGGREPNGLLIVVAERMGSKVLAYDGLLTQRFSVDVSDGAISNMIVADADNDGRNDVIVTAGPVLHAYHFNGVELAHFPRRLTDGSTFTGSPLLADINGDGRKELLCRTSGGIIRAFADDGGTPAGFPFQISSSGDGSLALFPTAQNRIGIMAVTSSGNLESWEVTSTRVPLAGDWTGYQLDAARSNFNANSSASIPAAGPDLLSKSQVYNWPNPVYGSTTAIRYHTAVAATINVKIYDIAGSSIAELQGTSAAGVDGEITWDVSNIQSGVYLARVEARGGGKTDVSIIKIAVVK